MADKNTIFGNLKKAAADMTASTIKMIDIDELHDSADNFFDVESRIEEFAETILGQGGVKDNLVVRPMENGYEIISGHRRKSAVRYLLDKGENISRFLPCLVQNYSDENDKKLDLVLLNISTRRLSDSELWKSYRIIKQILEEKKALGEKFGRVRDRLAEMLGVSTGQVNKIMNIDNNAIELIKEAVESGEMSFHAANEMAKLDTEKQAEIIAETEIKEITPQVIKKKSVTNDTKSDKVDDDGECVTNDTELDEIDDDGECVTNDTKLDEIEDNEECVTNDTKYADFDDGEVVQPPAINDRLARFVNLNFKKIDEMLLDMEQLADEKDVELISTFRQLLDDVKEEDRQKALAEFI